MIKFIISLETIHYPLGIDSRVKMISGMIVRGLYKMIFAVTRNDGCHVVSGDGVTWTCIMPEEWRHGSSSKDFVRAMSVPRNLKSELPESHFVVMKSDGTVSYGGNAKRRTFYCQILSMTCLRPTLFVTFWRR